jgi:hypothetical protein
VIGAVALLLLLNFSIISSNGKVEEMYVSATPELASADVQCKLFVYFGVCHCRYGGLLVPFVCRSCRFSVVRAKNMSFMPGGIDTDLLMG